MGLPLAAGVAILSFGMVTMGVLHLLFPAPFVRVIPPYLPAPEALVAISGFAEIVGGLGLLSSRTRRVAGIWLIVLLVAVFPANVHMALNRSFGLPAWLLWLRLPLQIPLIVWAWWASRRPEKQASKAVRE